MLTKPILGQTRRTLRGPTETSEDRRTGLAACLIESIIKSIGYDIPEGALDDEEFDPHRKEREDLPEDR